MGKTIISLALVAAFALPSFAQDIISMKNGTREEANVLEIDETTVRYKKFNNPEGPTYSVKKESVSEITYKNGTKENFDKKSQELSPEKNPNSVWWTKAKETKLGFWMDPLGFAQWGPMVGVSIRVGSNFDVKAHVRFYSKLAPIFSKYMDHSGYGFGLGLEFSKFIPTTNGNFHVGFLVESASMDGKHSDDYWLYLESGSSRIEGYLNESIIQYTFALTGGYTLRFNNIFSIDFSLQAGVTPRYRGDMEPDETLFYGDASLKFGIEL